MFDAGALLLVPVPFSDLTSTKWRPVLALTAPDAHGDFVACPVTSRDRSLHGKRLGALPLPSWVRTDRAVTLHVGLVVKTFGRVSETFRADVVQDLCRLLRLQSVDVL